MRPISWLFFLLALLFWGLVGCAGGPAALTPTLPAGILPTPTLATTASAPTLPAVSTTTPLPTATATPPPDTGWVTLQPGLERREIRLYSPTDPTVVRERIYILRLDPAFFRFDVAYRPGEPQSLSNWQEETGALVVVNGGFFTEDYVATGLVIVDAVPSGISYGGFAGMFAVTPAGPQVRWLQTAPYVASEAISAGLQSFPVLVKPGGVLGFPEEDGQAARRTVIAQDRASRIIMLVASRGFFTLHQLSRFLVESDMQLEIALNLDGGPSSGILLMDPEESVFPQAYVPAVITVYRR